MSFSGKKFKKVDFTNVIEIIDVLKIDDKTKGILRETEALSSFTKNADGSWTYKVEAGGKVLLNETFNLDKEFDFKRPDGVVNKTKFWLDGNILRQTMTGTEGKSLHFDRAFDGDKMTMTISLDGLATKGTVEYAAV